jgi:hypothetical protein
MYFLIQHLFYKVVGCMLQLLHQIWETKLPRISTHGLSFILFVESS